MSPKETEQKLSLGSPMAKTISASAFLGLEAPITDTNWVFSATFVWDRYTNSPIGHFSIYYGGQSRTYTNQVNAGTGTNFTIFKTNWPEEFLNHYYAMTVVDLAGVESIFSDEVQYQESDGSIPPPTHFTLSWPSSWTNAVIQSSTDNKFWKNFITVTATNSFTTNIPPDPVRFFRFSGHTNTPGFKAF